MAADEVADEGAQRGMPRKLVAFPQAHLDAGQQLADTEHPSGVPGKPGNVSQVIRDAFEHYLRFRGKL